MVFLDAFYEAKAYVRHTNKLLFVGFIYFSNFPAENNGKISLL